MLVAFCSLKDLLPVPFESAALLRRPVQFSSILNGSFRATIFNTQQKGTGVLRKVIDLKGTDGFYSMSQDPSLERGLEKAECLQAASSTTSDAESRL